MKVTVEGYLTFFLSVALPSPLISRFKICTKCRFESFISDFNCSELSSPWDSFLQGNSLPLFVVSFLTHTHTHTHPPPHPSTPTPHTFLFKFNHVNAWKKIYASVKEVLTAGFLCFDLSEDSGTKNRIYLSSKNKKLSLGSEFAFLFGLQILSVHRNTE